MRMMDKNSEERKYEICMTEIAFRIWYVVQQMIRCRQQV
jgi:hypothetical protein